MPRRVSSNAVLAVMAAAVVIGGILVYALLSGWGETPESEKSAVTGSLSASPSPSPAAVMAAGEAKDIEDGLVSNYRPVLNKVLADGYQPPIAPSGTVVKIDRESLRRHGATETVRASVTLPGKNPATITLRLVKDGSDWRVCAMEEVK